MTDLTCKLCKLCEGRTQVVPGVGPIPCEIMLVGEAPGAQEDKDGKPFVGRSGQLLRRAMQSVVLDVAHSYITNAVKCRPPSNRKPSEVELVACHKWLREEILAVKPKVIVALGATALDALTGWEWSVGAMRGIAIFRSFFMEHPAHLIVTWHPSYVLRRGDKWPDLLEDLAHAKRLAFGDDSK